MWGQASTHKTPPVGCNRPMERDFPRNSPGRLALAFNQSNFQTTTMNNPTTSKSSSNNNTQTSPVSLSSMTLVQLLAFLFLLGSSDVICYHVALNFSRPSSSYPEAYELQGPGRLMRMLTMFALWYTAETSGRPGNFQFSRPMGFYQLQ